MAKSAKKEGFESSLKKLEKLVGELESGANGLERSLEIFEQGVALAKELTQDLEKAKARVEMLSKQSSGLVKKAWEEA